ILDRVGTIIEKERSPKSKTYHFLESSYKRMDAYLEAYDPWQPSIELGDCMIFSQLALHRTLLTPMQRLPRLSAEVRAIGRTQRIVDHFVELRQPYFDVIGNMLKGPRVIRNVASGMEVLETGEWEIAEAA